MRSRLSWPVWLLAGALAAFTVPVLVAQAAPAQQKPQPEQKNTQKPSAPPAATNGGNPFPEDEKSVPLMPTGNEPDFSADMNGEGAGRASAPAVDKDPVRSPDDQAPDADDSSQGFSSSDSGLGNLANPPADDSYGKHGKKEDDSLIQPFPQATPKEDMSVGNYYLDQHDWRGALSRFESALVLAPDNPDVYWGLAECERHLGQFAAARANYLKVMEYDPGSHHAKEARKALRDPEIANAKP